MLVLSSAVLLIVSFPNFDQTWCAWIALVPWLLLLRGCSPRAAFGWSWLIGFLFFLGSIWWLVYVTVVGWLVLCAYLALFFGFFGRLSHSITSSPHHFITRLVTIPAAWVTLEYARSHLLTGFGWNLLGYSQTNWRHVIQIADVTGVWGVSFLIVLVNAALAAALQPRGVHRTRWAGLVLASVSLVAAVGYGTWRIPRTRDSKAVRVALVQGNIPTAVKWDAAFQEEILTRYESLTNVAAATRPDLIVWPETAVPGYLGFDEALTQRVLSLAQDAQHPLLVGSPTPVISPEVLSLTNSAILIDEAGTLAARYDKLHLVPFGEFIPFERTFPWLRNALPPIGDFTPGHSYTVFTVPISNAEFRMPNNSQFAIRNSQLPFSVLICFEDIFPDLARRFVQEGARLLLVITNDAWFGPTAAAYQHAQASTFRAIELRVPIARAANTGWSGCIDPAGRWVGSVQDAEHRELFVAGTHTCEVPLSSATSVYRRWGDWFALLCLAITLGWFLGRRRWYNTSNNKEMTQIRKDDFTD